MLPDAAAPVPASLMRLLAVFASLFTAPSFRTFTMLACGFLAQSGKRTVCGMLTGAGLSRLWLARRMVSRLAEELPGRRVNVTADSAYAGEELKQLPDGVTWTTRLRSNAALHGLPPARTGRRGRPRKKGDRLPPLGKIAAAAEFSQVTVSRYGKTETIAVHAFTCLWYSVTGTVPVTVILIRDKSKTGFDLALLTTEKHPDTARVIERYAARWAIEVAIEDSKQLFGTGQARNRTARAVERTVPFMLACQAIAVCWYAAGHHPADTKARRLDAPWYTSKTEPSTADMASKLRRVIIAAKFKRVHADQPEPAEIHAIRLAWEDAADLAA